MAASDVRSPDEEEKNSDSGSADFYSGGCLRIRKRREETGRKAGRHGSSDERDGCISGASGHRKH